LTFLANHEKYIGFRAKIIIAYGIWQPKFKEFKRQFPDTIFVPTLEELQQYLSPNCIILIDDFMTTISFDRKCNRFVTDLMTKLSHHMNLGVILTTQVAFPDRFKAISMNCNFQMFFSMRRDPTYSLWVGRQFRPDEPKIIFNALRKATKNNPYGCVVLDLTPETPEFLRIRNALIPDLTQDFQIYFAPQKDEDCD
jgi:hypothetical protein